MHPLYLLYAFSLLILGANSAQLPLEFERPWLNRLDHRLNTPLVYKDCGDSTYAIHITSIQTKPDPPQPGEKLSVTVNATVIKIIEDGAYVNVVVKLGLIKIVSKGFDVCKEARDANATLQCPVDPGNYTVTQTIDLPKDIPKATSVD
ncbi:phosphatidylglycerol phosphatidylinositol transfer protein [Moniliophthora roreri]|uniref:Phosphatidylglycerol/phosphatidylinositol transfer protein n=1 Tax=Moniliophthora roreri TaxID=221103 RepID=A0A0W0F9A0_MONRR|nr:phosphatidylglycerol phosphatidylinositol transfer protein [Moniliophthora roreri]